MEHGAWSMEDGGAAWRRSGTYDEGLLSDALVLTVSSKAYIIYLRSPWAYRSLAAMMGRPSSSGCLRHLLAQTSAFQSTGRRRASSSIATMNQAKRRDEVISTDRNIGSCRSRRVSRRHFGTSTATTTPSSSPASSSSSSTTTTAASSSFVDPALTWGRKHSKIAAACMVIPELPPPPLPDHNHRHIFQDIHTMEDYWDWRRWAFPVTHPDQLPLAHALVSHVLSAPLTVAAFHRALLEQPSPPSLLEADSTQYFHYCCVGARAEATVPHDFWKEVLVAVAHLDHSGGMPNTVSQPKEPPSLDITISFVGPDLPSQKTPPVTLVYGDARLRLQWLYRGFLHDYLDGRPDSNKDGSEPNDWTGFILLNPGIGHAHLKEFWKPTLDRLLPPTSPNDTKNDSDEYTHENKPILMTAHSELDARRDFDLLTQDYPAKEEYAAPKKNPFASRITYEDPFDRSHMVHPNHSSVMILPRCDY